MNEIEKQLLEIESLKCMYFCENEFKILNDNSIQIRELFLKNEVSKDLIDSIDVELNIVVNEIPVNIMVEIPVEYPELPFTTLIRCQKFNRQQHVKINSDASQYVSELDKDSISVSALIDWLMENLSSYSVHVEENSQNSCEEHEISYTRLWIYSHHLYCKVKKSNIKEWSKEMNLGGFFLAGKPGIICVEGLTEDTNMFWWNIRQLNWKRLVLKEQESISVLPNQSNTLIEWQKFKEFGEVTFVNSPDNSDFSLFIKWLKDLRCEHIIPILFGIEAK